MKQMYQMQQAEDSNSWWIKPTIVTLLLLLLAMCSGKAKAETESQPEVNETNKVTKVEIMEITKIDDSIVRIPPEKYFTLSHKYVDPTGNWFCVYRGNYGYISIQKIGKCSKSIAKY